MPTHPHPRLRVPSVLSVALFVIVVVATTPTTTAQQISAMPTSAPSSSDAVGSNSKLNIHDADVYTVSGYDNEFGSDPVCWVAPAHDKSSKVETITVTTNHDDHDHRRSRDLLLRNDDGKLGRRRRIVRFYNYDDERRELVDSDSGVDNELRDIFEKNAKAVNDSAGAFLETFLENEGIDPGAGGSSTVEEAEEHHDDNDHEGEEDHHHDDEGSGGAGGNELEHHDEDDADAHDDHHEEGDAHDDHSDVAEGGVIESEHHDDHDEGETHADDEGEAHHDDEDGSVAGGNASESDHHEDDAHDDHSGEADDHDDHSEEADAHDDHDEHDVEHDDHDEHDIEHDDHDYEPGAHDDHDEHYDAHGAHDKHDDHDEHDDDHVDNAHGVLDLLSHLDGILDGFVKVQVHNAVAGMKDEADAHDDHEEHDDHGAHDEHDDHSDEADAHGAHDEHDDHSGEADEADAHGAHDEHVDHSDEADAHEDHDDGHSDEADAHDDHDAHDEVGAHDDHDEHDDHSGEAHAHDDHSGDGEHFLGDGHGHVDLDNDGQIDQYDLETGAFLGKNWPNELVPDFVAGHTSMLPKCPQGLSIHVDGPPEMGRGEILRTGQTYKFRVSAEVGLDELRGQYGLSDDAFFYSSSGVPAIAIEIMFCPATGQFCSPFIFSHESHDEEGGEHSSHDGDEGDYSSHDGEHSSHDEDEEHGHAHSSHAAHEGGHRRLQGEAHHHDEEEEHADSHDEHNESDGDAHDDHSGEHEHSDEADSHDGHGHVDSHDSHDSGEGFQHLRTEEGDSHDGHGHGSHDEGEFVHLHIESETKLIEFTNLEQTKFRLDFEEEITVGFPGTFVPLGHLQLFLTNGTSDGGTPTEEDVIFKIDIGNTLHQGTVSFQSPPKINSVSLGVEILSYVVIFVLGSFLLFLLVATIKYRNHSIIKLSQGVFLVVCIFAALFATVATFLFNPKSDTYCLTYGPLIMIPLQVMLSVIIGRLQRIIAVMAPLMEWQQHQYSNRGQARAKKKLSRMLPAWVNNSGSGSGSESSGSNDNSTSRDASDSESEGEGAHTKASMVRKKLSRWKENVQPKSLRRQFSEARLWKYVAVMSLPQIIVQIIGIALFPQTLSIDYNQDESVGRQVCRNEAAPNYQYAEYAVLFVTIFFLIYQSQQTKRLPSLFDEAESISSALVSCVFVTAVGVAVIAVSNEPTSSADVRYLMLIAIVMTLTANMTYRLIYPKLKLIWKGEEVAVSQILADHKAALTKSGQSETAKLSTSSLPGVQQHSDKSFNASNPSLRNEKPVAAASDASQNGALKSALRNSLVTSENSISRISQTEVVSESNAPEAESSKGRMQDLKRRVSFASRASPQAPEAPEAPEERKKLEIRPNRSPPKEVTVTMVQFSELVARINHRMLSGLKVSPEEWVELKESLQKTNRFFEEDVRFSWEGHV